MASLARIVSFGRKFGRDSGAVVGALILGTIFVLAVIAPFLYPGDPLRIVGSAQIWPFVDGRFPLGTDSLGRDIAALLVHGARTTLVIGLTAAATSILIGVAVGATAGFYAGGVDRALMRATELFQTIPGLILALTIVTILGPAIRNVVLAIGIVSWPSIARVTRAEFLSWRNRDFVLACRAMGMGDLQLMVREILPNAITPVIGLSTLAVAGAILFESSLSFLGLADPEISTWGRLVGEGRSYIRTGWYICALPGAAILTTVFAINLVADGLAQALNPRAHSK